MMWRKLNADETLDFREAARRDISLDSELTINPLWHPVYRMEIAQMMLERAQEEIAELEKEK